MTTSEAHLAQLRALAREALDRVDIVGRTERVFAHAPRPTAVLAVGKSAGPMIDGAVRVLPADFSGPLVAIIPDGCAAPTDARVKTHWASHPFPDQRVHHNALQVPLHGAPLWLCLSGGGSACLSSPDDSISVDALAALTRALMLSGATIRELNTVRKALCPLLGGGLGRASVSVVAAVAVDISDEDVALVASGPALADAAATGDGVRIIERHGLTHLLPPAARVHMQGMPREGCPPFPHSVVASPSLLRRELVRLAHHADEVTPALTTLADVNALVDGALILGGLSVAVGEVTSSVPQNAPPGGRCAHLVLHALQRLRRHGRAFAICALGSDGRDGPTESAGACASEQLLARISAEEAEDALARGAAHPLLARHGALIPRFPSLVNLLDVILLWVDPQVVAPGTGHR